LIALIINIHTLGRVCCKLPYLSNKLETQDPPATRSSITNFKQLDMI